jgi:hypothetical protein
MDLPDDDHLQRAIIELGDPDALFRISRGRFLAKLAIGLLLILYGIVANYLWWVHGPATFGHFELLLLFVLPLTGVSLLLHMYRNRGLYVLIYPVGLLRLRRGEVDSFPWHDIDRITLNIQRAGEPEIARDEDNSIVTCSLSVDVPTFKLGTAGVTVVRSDGVEANFGPALSDFDELANQVQKLTFGVLWPRTRDQFFAGERLAFGELEVGLAGIRHNGKLLLWRDFKELAIAQGKLSIKQTGKWLPWALIDVATVPNPHILFALAAEATKHHRPAKEQPKSDHAE